MLYAGTIELNGENAVLNIILTEGIFPVGIVTATHDGEKAYIEWETPLPPIKRDYILDDGISNTGYRANPNVQNWLGNQFNVNEDGLLTSIDLYARAATDNTNREVVLDIYDAARQLVGSSVPFVFVGNEWINVPLNNILYSDTFYAMVRWTATPGQTHYLGYDTTGPNVNEGLNWAKVDENWFLMHDALSTADPGVFMVRANAYSFAFGGKAVSYGCTIQDETGIVQQTFYTLNIAETSFALQEMIVNKDDNNMVYHLAKEVKISSSVPKSILDCAINRSKGLENYIIYRFMEGQSEEAWEELSDNVTDTNFIDDEWAELPAGGYRYAVKVKYTTGSSIARVSNSLPKDWTVDYQVNITTNTGEPATGANVTLTNLNGNPDFIYTKFSGPDGVLMEEIFKGTYTLTVSLTGYETYSVSDLEITEEGLSHNAFINEILYPVGIITAVEVGDNVIVDWTEAGQSITFRYDNGNATGQIGLDGTYPRGVMGSCHRVNATLNNISWYLTNNADGNPTPVNVWVFALNAQGMPSSQVLFNQNGVTSTKMEWNIFDFPEPVEAPNGFFIALSHSTGFLSLGTTTPKDEYPLPSMTHFYTGDFTQYDYIPLEEDFAVNIMIRTEGIVMGKEASFGYPASKALTGYNVYRLTAGQDENERVQLATNQQSNSYTDNTWSSLTFGEYQYAVKAVYTGGLLSPAKLSASIFKDAFTDYRINIVTNSGHSPAGATVKLTNQNGNINHIYTKTSDDNGVLFENIWKGVYDLSIKLRGYEDYTDTDIEIIETEEPLVVTLNDVVFPVTNVTAKEVENNAVIEWTEGVPPISEWIQYCVSDFVLGGLGIENTGLDMTVAMRFSPSDLTNLEIVSGDVISKIALGIGTHINGISTMEIRIWEGGSSINIPGQLLYTQPIINFASFT